MLLLGTTKLRGLNSNATDLNKCNTYTFISLTLNPNMQNRISLMIIVVKKKMACSRAFGSQTLYLVILCESGYHVVLLSSY